MNDSFIFIKVGNFLNLGIFNFLKYKICENFEMNIV